MSGISPGITASTELNNNKLGNVDEAFRDPGQVQLRSAGPLISQTLLRKGNESSVTSRPKSKTSNTLACHRLGTRRRERSDDERRLLGDYEKDPDAVAINCPRNPSRYSSMTPSILQGGHQPINTLGSGGTAWRGINRDRKVVASFGIKSLKRGYQGGSHSSLDIVSTSGDNVGDRVKSFDFYEERPPRKKHRPTATSVIPSDCRQQTRMVDDDDILMLDNGKPWALPRIAANANHSSPVLSQGSEVVSNSQLLRGRAVRLGSQEYRMTEETMRAPSKSIHRLRNSQPATAASGATPRSAIDLSSDYQVLGKQKQPYQGTARENGSRGTSTGGKHRHALHQSETGTKSKHFSNIKKPKISSSMRGSNARSTVNQVEQPSLRSSFVDDNGKRRDSLIGDSADELQNGTTIGSHSCEIQPFLAHMPLGSSEQFRVVNTAPVTPPRQVQGLAESNIRGTEFTSSGRQSSKIRVGRAPRGRRSTTDWGVGLVRFQTGSADLNGRTSCGLVYDATKETFVVKYEGKDLSEENPDLSITPTRVVGILMGDGNCCKLRLLSSRSATADHRIDIELDSHQNALELKELLQEITPGIRSDTKKSDKMDQLFENRSSDFDPQFQSEKKPLTNMGDDIQFLQNKEQRKKTKAGIIKTEPEVYRQRLSRNHKIDAIAKPARMNILGNQSQSPHDSSYLSQRTTAARLDGETGSNTHQGPIRDQHQTRSQMQQSASDSLITTKLSPEPPPEKRYSKIYGLGSPWAKPLVFPQAGKRKATVEFEDLQRLDEGEFLNDNLMGFYLRYLEHTLEQMHDGLAQKIYFFNTYFYASLTRTPRGKRGINYEAVQKWTRTVDIFAYDYVVVPINESAHWYVAIICNLPALDRNLEAEDQSDLQAPVKISSDDAPSLSSRAPSSSIVDEIERKAAIYDVDADGTRNSFAEMNLEGKQEPYNHGMAEHSMLSHEVSHLPNEELRRKDDNPKQPTKLDLEISEASPSTTQLSNDRTPPCLKKGRRKSTTRLQKYKPGGPIIITLDSLGLSHSPTVRILKDYLAQEGKEKRALEYPDDAIKGMTAKGIPLQNNFCDCGLYLLGYLDKLVHNPQDLCHKILQRELDAEVDWPTLKPSLMRDELRTRIQKLHMEQEAERKETAKRTGKYISRGHPKPAIGPGSLEIPPSVPLPNPDEGRKQGFKATRQSALESAIPLDQEPQSKVSTIKNPPMIKSTPADSNSGEKGAQSVNPTAPSQEDSLVYLGESRVRRDIPRTPDMERPSGGEKDEREHAPESQAASSPRKYLEKVEIRSRSPTLGDGEMLEV